jgi:predicted membrane-bound spermidine synthase
MPSRRLAIAVFCSAASTLALEIALTRLTSALFFTHITALLLAACLAALGLGAAVVHRYAATRPLTMALLGWLAALGALSGLLALVCAAHVPLLFLAGAFAGPFLLAGALAAVAYRLSSNPTATFAWEALGAAVGASLAPLLLNQWGDVTAALLALLLLLPATLVTAPRATWLFLPLLASLVLPHGLFEPDPFATPGFLPHLVEQTRTHHGRVLQTRVDSYARTDLVQTDEPWLRYLYTDRMYPARVLRWDGQATHFADPESDQLTRLKRLPFEVVRPDRVLVLGAGGGLDVALALQAGARDVDAVEVNAAMIGLVQGLATFCGRLYNRAEVHVHSDEARRFLRDPHPPWDVVQLSLMQSDAAALRSVAGVQNWVLTREAVRAYLEQLTPRGTLVIVQNTPEFADRTAWTVAAALVQRGVQPADVPPHLVALELTADVRNPFGKLLLVRTQPFTPIERAALLQAAQAVDATPRALPRTPHAFSLPTDAHPQFYPTHPVLLGLYSGLALAALAMAWLLFGHRQRHSQPLPRRNFAQALLLGAGLMLVQAVLLSEAQFLLGHPPLAVAWTVGGLLAASALGAWLAQRLNVTPKRQMWLAALLVTALLLPLLVGPDLPFLPANPHLAVALLVLPLGLALGPGFPAFLSLAGGDDGRHRAVLYAIDGLGAVAGGGLAALLYASAGTAAVVVAAMASYAGLACVTILAGPRQKPRGPEYWVPPSC